MSKLTRITLYPAPHVEMRIVATEQMVEDLKKCAGNCFKCSWREITIDGDGVCGMDSMEKWIKENLKEKKHE